MRRINACQQDILCVLCTQHTNAALVLQFGDRHFWNDVIACLAHALARAHLGSGGGCCAGAAPPGDDDRTHGRAITVARSRSIMQLRSSTSPHATIDSSSEPAVLRCCSFQRAGPPIDLLACTLVLLLVRYAARVLWLVSQFVPILN